MPVQEFDHFNAEAKAYQLIQECCIRDPRDLQDLEALAWQMKVYVETGGIRGCDGRLVRRGKHGIIRIRENIDEPGRRRFIIGHELGHWLLHSEESQVGLCTAEDMDADAQREYRHSRPELEASAFASELLMPSKMFRENAKALPEGVQGLQALAGLFSTSYTSTAVRMVDLLDEYDMMVIAGPNGVHWWRGRPNVRSLWCEKRQQIQPDSGAGRIFASGDKSFADEVPWDVWFPHVSVPVGQSIWEETVFFPNYGTTLSLLQFMDLE